MNKEMLQSIIITFSFFLVGLEVTNDFPIITRIFKRINKGRNKSMINSNITNINATDCAMENSVKILNSISRYARAMGAEKKKLVFKSGSKHFIKILVSNEEYKYKVSIDFADNDLVNKAIRYIDAAAFRYLQRKVVEKTEYIRENKWNWDKLFVEIDENNKIKIIPNRMYKEYKYYSGECTISMANIDELIDIKNTLCHYIEHGHALSLNTKSNKLIANLIKYNERGYICTIEPQE